MNGTNQLTTGQSREADVLHCLWMDAGVVDYKLCDRNFDCDHCPFDEVLHGKPARQISFGAKQNESKASTTVEGCEIANDVFFHPSHVWMRVEEGGIVRLGLDDFCQRLFGPAFSLSLPELQTAIKRGEVCCRFTHQSGVAALFAPVSGKVKATNVNLKARPALINRDPYGKGWLMLVEPTDLKSCLKRSLYGEQVGPWLAQEIEKLGLLIDSVSNGGQTAPATLMDGGVLTKQFLRGLSVEQTRRVISSFFPLSSITEAEQAILLKSGR